MRSERIRSYEIIKQAQDTSGVRICHGRRGGTDFVIQIISLDTAYVHQTEDIDAKEIILEEKCQKYVEMNHPNLISIYDLFLHQSNGKRSLIVVEELFFKENTIKIIKESNDIDAISVKQILVGLARAIEYLHQRDIVHGNLNMSAVKKQGDVYKLYLSSLKEVKLFRRKFEKTRSEKADKYTAPEKNNQQGFSFQADIWSFAIIIMQFLLKESVGSAKDTLPCCQEKFPSHELLLRLPNSKTRQLIDKMLQKDPLRRPKIVKVREILENIDFLDTDNDFQEEILEAKVYEKIIIPLFRPQSVEMLIDQNQLQLPKQKQMKNSLRSTSFRTSSSIITIYMTDTNILSIHFKGIHSPFSHTVTIPYNSLSENIRQYFPSITNLFDEIEMCSNEQIRISGCGGIQFSFDRQRCQGYLNNGKESHEQVKEVSKQNSEVIKKTKKQFIPKQNRGIFYIKPQNRISYLKISETHDPEIKKLLEDYEYQPHGILQQLRKKAQKCQFYGSYSRYYLIFALYNDIVKKLNSYDAKLRKFYDLLHVGKKTAPPQTKQTETNYLQGLRMIEQKDVYFENYEDVLEYACEALLIYYHKRHQLDKLCQMLIKYHRIIISHYGHSTPALNYIHEVLCADIYINRFMSEKCMKMMKELTVDLKFEIQYADYADIISKILTLLFFHSKSQLTDTLFILLDAIAEILDNNYNGNLYKKMIIIQDLVQIQTHRHSYCNADQLERLEEWMEMNLPKEVRQQGEVSRFFM